MSKHLERGLEALERELLALSSMVEEMIDKACLALIRGQLDTAAEVIRCDGKVDDREVHIEEECLKILALHQPVATDLRRVAAVLKINNDLERIADLAVNVAERVETLAVFQRLHVPTKLEEMAVHARRMVRNALDSFVNLDEESARQVRQQDAIVDQLNGEVIRVLQDMVRECPDQVEPAFCLFSAARQFERIADHATNIAEDVIYLVEGEIARHKHDGVSAGKPGVLTRNAWHGPTTDSGHRR
jgi:phosphate transport system protein